MSSPSEETFQLRTPVELRAMPTLARWMISPARKPSGLGRTARKIVNVLYALAYHRFRMSARGALALVGPNGKREFSADFSNTGYLDYLNHSARGGYEPEVSAFLDSLAGDVSVVYDVGANWGYFVALLATNPRFKGKIHAFEIAPKTFRDLARFVTECHLSDGVTCHPFGLSSDNGTAFINEGMHTYLTRITTDPRRAVAVPVRRLDDLDIPDPYLIKIDVEGHEVEVLRGGFDRIRRSLPIIVFESWYEPDRITNTLEPMALLSSLGYRFYQAAWETTVDGQKIYSRSPAASSKLVLLPLAIENRALIPCALNIIAAHPTKDMMLKRINPCDASL